MPYSNIHIPVIGDPGLVPDDGIE